MNEVLGSCRSETFLMMRTLRDMNMSKLVSEDVPLFISLIDDLFPSQKAERTQFPDITAALEKVGSLAQSEILSNSNSLNIKYNINCMTILKFL